MRDTVEAYRGCHDAARVLGHRCASAGGAGALWSEREVKTAAQAAWRAAGVFLELWALQLRGRPPAASTWQGHLTQGLQQFEEKILKLLGCRAGESILELCAGICTACRTLVETVCQAEFMRHRLPFTTPHGGQTRAVDLNSMIRTLERRQAPREPLAAAKLIDAVRITANPLCHAAVPGQTRPHDLNAAYASMLYAALALVEHREELLGREPGYAGRLRTAEQNHAARVRRIREEAVRTDPEAQARLRQAEAELLAQQAALAQTASAIDVAREQRATVEAEARRLDMERLVHKAKEDAEKARLAAAAADPVWVNAQRLLREAQAEAERAKGAAAAAEATKAQESAALERTRLQRLAAEGRVQELLVQAEGAKRDAAGAAAALAGARARLLNAEACASDAAAQAAAARGREAEAEAELRRQRAAEHGAAQRCAHAAAQAHAAERVAEAERNQGRALELGILEKEQLEQKKERDKLKLQAGGLLALPSGWFKALLALCTLLHLLAMVANLNSTRMLRRIPGAGHAAAGLLAMLLLCGLLWCISSVGLVICAVWRRGGDRPPATYVVHHNHLYGGRDPEAGAPRDGADQAHTFVLPWWYDNLAGLGWHAAALAALSVIVASPALAGILIPLVFFWDLLLGARVDGTLPNLLPGLCSLRLAIMMCYIQAILNCFPSMIASGAAHHLTNSCLIPGPLGPPPLPLPSPSPPHPIGYYYHSSPSPSTDRTPQWQSPCSYGGARAAAAFSLAMSITAFLATFGLWVGHIAQRVRLFDFTTHVQHGSTASWELTKLMLTWAGLVIGALVLLPLLLVAGAIWCAWTIGCAACEGACTECAPFCVALEERRVFRRSSVKAAIIILCIIIVTCLFLGILLSTASY